MENTAFKLLVIIVAILFSGCGQHLEKQFINPPDEYKPKPFWHINGELTTEGIRKQMKDARDLANFSGVAVLPLTDRSENRPGTSPDFLSEEYFERYFDILNTAKELKMEVILYDDIDFPSGMAGGKMEKLHPEFTRKRIDKVEKEVTGPAVFKDSLPDGKMMSVVAMNMGTMERVELSNHVNGKILNWKVPKGKWKIMFFPMVTDGSHKKYLMVDYMDTLAVRHLLKLTYERYADKLGEYFGEVIKTVFFDDVGFFQYERGWTGAFNEKFAELNGFDPKPWYPALWYNIGPETEAVRHAFFKTRAELLSDGFMKLVGEWSEKHGLKDTGHPPGNYRVSPIDMNGDIFKFYRHTDMPLTDAIISYGTGLHGFKLISSAADYYDKPVVPTEIYGAFKENTIDSFMLYRPLMEQLVRGINYVFPHGLWYNSDPGKIHISPLISPYCEKLAPALPAYSNFVGRTCLMLQGGRKVSEIGVLYPFESLAGYFYFDAPKTRYGEFVSPGTDYLKISDLLTNEIRCDFTFIHPEFFLEDKYEIENGTAKLNNTENFQEYKVLFLTGCNIISYKTLEKIKSFYESGGTVISTTQLPFKSAEIGYDKKVIDLIHKIFAVNALEQDTSQIQENSNSNGGYAVFVPNPGKETIQSVLGNQMVPDVVFSPNPELISDFGKFSYIHKVKDNRDIFYFANSSDEPIQTKVLIRGRFKLEKWNPHNGSIDKKIQLEYVQKDGENYTRFALNLEPVRSLFYLGKNQ